MPRVRTFRDLVVWQRSIDLVTQAYSLTDGFPRREVYGIVAQIRKSAVSVPANIAEGSARPTTKDFIRFLGIAMGSLRELQTYFEISRRLAFATDGQLEPVAKLADETGALLSRMGFALRRKAGR